MSRLSVRVAPVESTMPTSLFNINFNIGFRETSARPSVYRNATVVEFFRDFLFVQCYGRLSVRRIVRRKPGTLCCGTASTRHNSRTIIDRVRNRRRSQTILVYFLFIPIADISQPHDGSPTPRRRTGIFGISLVVVVYSYLLYHNEVFSVVRI